LVQGQKVVGNARFGAAGGKKKLRIAWPRHVKEKDSILPAQEAKQPSAGERVLVRREMAVVRFVADIARRRNWNRLDDATVVRRVFIKINNGKKIRGQTRLIAGPDIQRFRRSVSVIVVASLMVMSESASHERRGEQKQDLDCSQQLAMRCHSFIPPLLFQANF